MNQEKEIVKFIHQVATNNLANANKTLKTVIDEKIKSKIRDINAKLSENKKS